MFSKLCEVNTTSDWSKYISKVEFAINNTINRGTGFEPSVLLYGVRQRGELCDRVQEFLEAIKSPEPKRELDKIREKSSELISRNQEYNKISYDKKHKLPRKYELGDYVLIKNIVSTTGINKKFLPKFRGPYEVVKILENDRYLIKDISGMQISRIPYNGICSPANMKPYMMKIKDSSNEEH